MVCSNPRRTINTILEEPSTRRERDLDLLGEDWLSRKRVDTDFMNLLHTVIQSLDVVASLVLVS
jgi:hypothetical protein